ncbi:N-methylhydantoinase (ATP-hydrolyzing) A 2 [Salinisphaera sp. PC39]|uniref:hydantoinase/oxoprolinase family protein n=1 Tax=Salinisphaera sp. PC39 TaxID=1304156 RepID=UPI00333FD2B6
MAYHLGVDVGGTFTDVLLIDEDSGKTYTAKVPSTPEDSSQGVLNGITKVCERAGVDPTKVDYVMHGTTVATNAVLTGKGAKVGLVATKGYGQVLQIARSYVPGGLGGWVIYNKSEPLAPLENTVEVAERIGADGTVVTELSEDDVRAQLTKLKDRGIEALTVSLINAYANPEHERRIKAIAEEMLPDVAISLSSEVIPEMQEYERTLTTVANSFVRPGMKRYVENLQSELDRRMDTVKLYILRSDGGLASAQGCVDLPVNHLMSGPAGGVSGAIWMAGQAGYKNLLTLDMGGTSTDVCLVQDAKAQVRRETTVGDLTIRASSVDVRTVGAGGGSIAHVPELTKALRVGPESAGAEPGPAAYRKGGTEPTVTDANVVLGYLPATTQLGGEMQIGRDLAEQAVAKVAEPLGLPLKKAAAGIIDIVNENMFGALRLVSVEQGYDPRDFALVGFGGAGPLHANALGKLMGAWPVIIPPGPGVLCAYGDATTVLRNEAAQTFVRRFPNTEDSEVLAILKELSETAARHLDDEGVPREDQNAMCQIDLRYHGQVLMLTVDMPLDEFEREGLKAVGERFDDMHTQLYTFALEEDKEIVNLRVVVQGKPVMVEARHLPEGGADPAEAKIAEESIFVEGADHDAAIYDRAKLKAGNRVPGPAIVMEMDSTTVILPDHVGEIDLYGNILIRPADRVA